jgi:hypothetical protein
MKNTNPKNRKSKIFAPENDGKNDDMFICFLLDECKKPTTGRETEASHTSFLIWRIKRPHDGFFTLNSTSFAMPFRV